MGAVAAMFLIGGGWLSPTEASSIDGTACYYDPGLMEMVARNRGVSLHGFVGGVALDRAGDRGRSVWLQWEKGNIEGPFLSVDCAKRKHVGGCVVEVDASVAKRHGFFGVNRVPVRVYFEDGPDASRLSGSGYRPR